MYRVQHYEETRRPKIPAHLTENENWITLNNVLKNINCFVLSVCRHFDSSVQQVSANDLHFNYFKIKIVQKKLHKKRRVTDSYETCSIYF